MVTEVRPYDPKKQTILSEEAKVSLREPEGKAMDDGKSDLVSGC
jgi:hypothetical protein